jgi:molecular chaperone IbpA
MLKTVPNTTAPQYNKSRESLMNLFDSASNAMLGFSPDFGRTLMDSVASSSQSYPPYNLIEISENEYRVEVACAGFKKDDLDVNVEKNVLTISGKKHQTTDESDTKDDSTPSPWYFHKGISSRSFKRTFVLGEHVKVVNASYEDGILTVSVIKEIPPEDKPKLIPIS